MTRQTRSRPTYRVKGTTDDVTTCQQCGRGGLRKTVALALLDVDGNEDEVTYFGVDCAARATGQRQTAIRNAAAAADRHMDQAQRWAREMSEFYDVEPTLAAQRYHAANRRYIEEGGHDPAAEVARLVVEIRAVLAGQLVGTRYAPRA